MFEAAEAARGATAAAKEGLEALSLQLANLLYQRRCVRSSEAATSHPAWVCSRKVARSATSQHVEHECASSRVERGLSAVNLDLQPHPTMRQEAHLCLRTTQLWTAALGL